MAKQTLETSAGPPKVYPIARVYLKAMEIINAELDSLIVDALQELYLEE